MSSGIITFTDAQLIFIFGFIGVFFLFLTLYFVNAFIFFNLFFSCFFLFAIVFKLYIALKGSRYELHQAVTKDEVRAVENSTLPVYTILLPVYKKIN